MANIVGTEAFASCGSSSTNNTVPTYFDEQRVLQESLYGYIEQVTEGKALLGAVQACLQQPGCITTCLQLLCLHEG